MVRRIVGALALGMLAVLWAASQAQAQPRIALVIGNANYAKGPLRTPLADGGLIAETLNSAGFEIVEGADVGQGDLRRIFRDFLAKVEAAGPETIAFVYFAGYALSFEGENFLVPVDVKLDRESDIPLDAVRLNDLIRPLAAIPARARVVVMDAARPHPFAMPDARLAAGLVAIEPSPGMLIAYSSAPGTVAEDGQDAYGPFAVAVSEMMREPGLDLDSAFTRIRVRTHQATEGRQTPWHMSALGAPVAIALAATPAAAPSDASAPAPSIRLRRTVRPMSEVPTDDAYALAIEQDSLPAYSEFVQTYPRSPYAPRIWAIIRARREALAWMRAVEFNTPESYWTYLRRYPNGIYAEDARRRLRRLAALLEPPPVFAAVEFVGVPEPLIGEPVAYVSIYPPAPSPPVLLIEPVPPFYLHLPPPPPPRPGFLAVSATMPVVSPGIRRPPRTFADPRAVKPAALTPVSPAPVVSPPPTGAHVRPGGPDRPTVPGVVSPQKPASIATTPAKPPAVQAKPRLMKKQPALGAAGAGAGQANLPPDRTKLAPRQPSIGGRSGPLPPSGAATPAQGSARTMPSQRQPAPRTTTTQPRAAAPAIRQAPRPTVRRTAPPPGPAMRIAPPPPSAGSPRPQTPMVARPTAPAAPRAPAARRCAVVNGKEVCR